MMMVYEGWTPASEITHQLCVLWRQECFQHHHSVKVLCENLKYFLSLITITFKSQKYLRKRNRQQREIFRNQLGWRGLRNFDSFLWMTSDFFKIPRTVECVMLFFLATSRDDALM
jgi:hypothetical protein